MADLGRIEAERDPDLRGLRGVDREVGRERERARHHADDSAWNTVEADLPTEHARISRVAALPDPVSEHGNGRAAGPVLVGGEHAPEERSRAERVEGPGRNAPDADPDGVASVRHVRLAGVPGGDALEARAEPAVVVHLRVRDPGLLEGSPAAPDHHPPLRMVPRERREKDRADDGEHRRRGAHPEAERQDGGSGETGRTPQMAEGVADVLKKGLHEILLAGRTLPGRRLSSGYGTPDDRFLDRLRP
ncbi:MAG: hypothetical protein ABI592_12620 [Acidobacteriota bacterium]